MLTKNKCLIDRNIIELKSVHALVSCKCESCYIDAGNYYAQQVQQIFSEIVKILDNRTEIKGND